VLVEFYSWGIPDNVNSGRTITNAKKSIADRIISNRQVNREVLCITIPAPLWPINIASLKGVANHRGF
jgi:hypothetical protein